MDNCLAQLQMYDYLLKKYRNKEVFPDTRMIVEIDGKLWTGDFLQLDDCHIIEIDWEDTRFTRIERTKDAINDEFNEKVTNSNVNVSENRIDSKIGSLKNIEILYHVTLEKESEPDYEVVFAYHQQACAKVITEMDALITKHK
ncbi:hypothetical protein DG48_10360 [Listeria monocytogenes]|nr:hypothetical protein [Listeria monocytogenes]